MRKILIIILLMLFSTSYMVSAEEFNETRYVKPNGHIIVTQTSQDGKYSYSRDFAPNEHIVMPTERINMTNEEINQLRNTPITSQKTGAHRIEMPSQSVDHFVSKIDGTWYDYNGNLVLAIKDGYINNCQITNGFDFVGGYPTSGTLRISESTGPRDININAFGDGSHKYIIIDGKIPLRQTQKAQYIESVNGVYLGMTLDDVVKIYGRPTQIITTPSIGSIREDYLYQGNGVNINFTDHIVTGITICNGSSAHFDKTGYTCMNSLEDYYTKYNLNRLPTTPTGNYSSTGAYAIGDGEYLFFDDYPNTVALSIYSN